MIFTIRIKRLNLNNFRVSANIFYAIYNYFKIFILSLLFWLPTVAEECLCATSKALCLGLHHYCCFCCFFSALFDDKGSRCNGCCHSKICSVTRKTSYYYFHAKSLGKFELSEKEFLQY